jgi:hypothetical protein
MGFLPSLHLVLESHFQHVVDGVSVLSESLVAADVAVGCLISRQSTPSSRPHTRQCHTYRGFCNWCSSKKFCPVSAPSTLATHWHRCRGHSPDYSQLTISFTLWKWSRWPGSQLGVGVWVFSVCPLWLWRWRFGSDLFGLVRFVVVVSVVSRSGRGGLAVGYPCRAGFRDTLGRFVSQNILDVLLGCGW